MAVAAAVFDETQRATLEALCETFVPSVETDTGDPLEQEFMARSALDMQIPAQIEGMLAQSMTPEEIAEVAGLLDALAAEDLAALPVEARTQVVHGFRDADPEAKLGLDSVRGLTLLLFYALPDDEGGNPNWEAIGFPGPVSQAPDAADAPKTITVEDVQGESATLSADAVVVGSGAGGSVIASQLAAAGKQVLVLEMGGVPQRAGLQPARAAGHAGALLRRRAGGVGGRLDLDPRGLDARRRDGRELHELHPDPGADRGRVVLARPRRARRLRGLQARPHRPGDGAHQAPTPRPRSRTERTRG